MLTLRLAASIVVITISGFRMLPQNAQHFGSGDWIGGDPCNDTALEGPFTCASIEATGANPANPPDCTGSYSFHPYFGTPVLDSEVTGSYCYLSPCIVHPDQTTDTYSCGGE